MAIQQKLDDDDLAFLEIIEDQIWFGEFLRSTNDGEIDEALHPPKKWFYRDYQRQFLSDESEFILYTGGRAIGKCQPSSARIYTTDGYRTISSLLQEDSFIVYTLTSDMTIEQRRAIVRFDKETSVFQLKTESGYKLDATLNHPILTPTGYRLMQDIKPGDYVAVATQLPHESHRSALRWHELRLLGYVLLMPKFRATNIIKPRFNKIGAELEIIADRLLVNWHKDKHTGVYKLLNKPGPFKHPITSLLFDLKLGNMLRLFGARRIPVMIKQERLENIRVFLEALFAQFAELSRTKILLTVKHEQIALDIQELLLRFGIETKISHYDQYTVETLNARAVYRFWNTFTLPGVAVSDLQLPPATDDATDFMRFDRVIDHYQVATGANTYAIHVYETENYISDNVFVHNSVVLEDKIVWEVINKDITFPITPESVLVTPNQAQMTPLLNKIILRFTTSKFLRDFLKNNVNKSDGTMKFMMQNNSKPLIFNFRIAGSRGENNMVGLHIPRIRGDEMQLFPLNAFTQLGPTYNGWEPKRQQLYAGVPNGLRNSVLYQLDHNPRYKRYHIPSHMNPYYSFEDDQNNIRTYLGEQSDLYQQLVLGRHGQAAYQVIPRETMHVESASKFPFYSYQYNSTHHNKGVRFEDHLQRPAIKDVETTMIAIDPGFVDSAIIQVFSKDKFNVWRTNVRYRLKRIDFNEQQNIIHWIAQYYGSSVIAIDIGAGGNGSSIMHNLMYGDSYKGHKYDKRMVGIQFKENVLSGYDDEGEELFQEAKAFATVELARIIQEQRLIFSELDHEGMGELERVVKMKSTAGRDRYFVMNEKGAGAADEDHIYASYVVWAMASRQDVPNPHRKTLARSQGSHSDNDPLRNNNRLQ